LLGIFDHGQGDAIFDAAAGVGSFHLPPNGGTGWICQAVEANKGGMVNLSEGVLADNDRHDILRKSVEVMKT
jgi:hypothetical protein